MVPALVAGLTSFIGEGYVCAMELHECDEIEDVDGGIVADYTIKSRYLAKGWRIFAIRTVRDVKKDGAFEDRLIYTLGRKKPE